MPPPLPGQRFRSVFVTVLAWGAIVVSALGVPVSVISLLMILAGSYGTANASILGGLLVIGGPFAGVVIGIGLLRRWRWAHAGALALLVVFAVVNFASLLRGSTPEHTYVSPAGVPTTVLASNVNYPMHLLAIAMAVGLIAKLASKSVRDEFGDTWSLTAFANLFKGAPLLAPELSAPHAITSFSHNPTDKRDLGWRIGHQGRDELYYEEWRDGAWQRLRVRGEMLMGRAHHVIYFANPQAWLNYPAWAQGRRDEIIARIKSEFRAPDYEYQGDEAVTAPAIPNAVAVVTASNAVSTPRVAVQFAGGKTTRSQWRALIIAIALMLGLAGGMGWMVGRGLVSGQTRWPAKLVSQQRPVFRAQEPVTFWFSLGVYTTIGAGAFGLAAWGMREGRRISQHGR